MNDENLNTLANESYIPPEDTMAPPPPFLPQTDKNNIEDISSVEQIAPPPISASTDEDFP